MSDFIKSDSKTMAPKAAVKDIQGIMSQKIIEGAAVSMSNDLPFQWEKSTMLKNSLDIQYQNSTQSSINNFDKGVLQERSSILLRPIFSNFSTSIDQAHLNTILTVLNQDSEMNSINKKLSKDLVQGEFSRVEYRIGIFSQMGKSREFIGEETNAKVCDAICRATYELIRDV